VTEPNFFTEKGQTFLGDFPLLISQKFDIFGGFSFNKVLIFQEFGQN
jgi:hypothetical protein